MNHSLSAMCRLAIMLVALAAVIFHTATCGAEPPVQGLELATPFADHAILQRGTKVPVWGWSKPGTKVTVQFAGQSKTVTAGKNGKWMRTIAETAKSGADMSTVPQRFPGFPKPDEVVDVKPDMIPTYVYNWCVSPFTPMAVSGVVWVPGQANIGHEPKDYAAELETYAKSLPGTYGQDKVQFIYAQPAGSLIEGITTPSISGAKQLTFDDWPKSLKEIATELGAKASAR